MKSTIMAALAAATMSLLACEKAPTSPEAATGPLAPGHVAPSFITHGTLDGDAHPAVVLIVMDVDGVPSFLCSGTLIAPTFVLTAGHCVGEPGEFSAIRIFTESDVENGENNFPFIGPNSIEAVAWAAHPEFTEAAFFLHDAGMIQLASPVVLPASEYGTLPTVNQLDALRPGNRTRFTTVGYGIQRINPVKFEGAIVRMVAEPRLVQINKPNSGTFSLLISSNASTGGICFGDSGGPTFLGSTSVIAGVNDFLHRNGNCVALGGIFRLDRQDVLDFISGFVDSHS
jgi:hypothetical protein